MDLSGLTRPLLRSTAASILGALAAAGANTYNSVYDRDIDALMARTHRPALQKVQSLVTGAQIGDSGTGLPG